MLVHCLSGRQTYLQQCCRSLAAVPASTTLLGNTACFSVRFNKNEVGIIIRDLRACCRIHALKTAGSLELMSRCLVATGAYNEIIFWVLWRATVNNFSSVTGINVISCFKNLFSCSYECSRWLVAEEWLLFFKSGYILQARWINL